MLDDNFGSDHGFVKEALGWNWVRDQKYLRSNEAGRNVLVPGTLDDKFFNCFYYESSRELRDALRLELIEAYLARAPRGELVSEFRDYWVAKCNAVGCDVPEKVSVTPSLIEFYCKEFNLSGRLKDFLVLRITEK